MVLNFGQFFLNLKVTLFELEEQPRI